jgi:uncharacterized RDD family membrane protein YckC
MMPDARTCPRCGTTIPIDAPEDLCPRCLLDGLTDGSTLSRTREAPESSGLRVGQDLGRYRLLRRLGRGGFGEVWEAESHETGRHTALKLLPEARHASAEALERFAREGRLAASLSHPRCVFVFGADTVDGYPAIDMELMDGGTLQDVLGREGPMPYPRAVDAVLDMIDGLEAAHAAGILHRDVKPSNAFVDADGRVKIGDFGLSKSLEDQELLSSAGGFIGTPSYASPEQVRGAELDVRSDIYSVGATLYALLAGHAPFRGRRATEVLAKILADDPPPIAVAGVPASLARIVRRTLAKSPEARPRDYASLRAALLPFSARGLGVPGVARRAVAKVIDNALLVAVQLLVFGAWSKGLLFVLGTAALDLAYFSVTEGLWGRSLGKRLLGLRVVGRDDRPIGVRQAFVRAVVFLAFARLAWMPRLWTGGGPGTGWDWLFLAASFAVFVTMRRRNGYSGIHDLASRTWVRTIAASPLAPRLPEAPPAVAAAQDRRFGPYVESYPLQESAAEGVLVAWDPLLRRNIWVHHFAPDLPMPTLAQIAVTTPHRLRWLQGTREGTRHWDAYEAPRGTTLAAWIQARGTLSWSDLRRVLHDVVEELTRTLAQRDARSVLSTGRLWVDANGSVRLLDFALAPEEGGALAPGGWRVFLHQLVHFALNGRLEAIPLDIVPPVLLPELARPVVARLCGAAPAFDTPSEVAAALQELEARPAEISRRRRFVSLGPSLAMPLQISAVIVLAMAMRLSTAAWSAFEAKRHAAALSHETAGERREACRVLAGWYWAKVPEGSVWRRVAGDRDRTLLEDARRDYGEATDARAARAAARTLGLPDPDPEGIPVYSFLSGVGVTVAMPLMVGAVVALPLALVLRGGLGLRLSGIAVLDASHEPATRVRCLFRGFCAWSPMWLVHVYWKVPFRLHPDGLPFQVVTTLGLILMTVGAAYALWRPERSLQDLLAGTRLVPR